MNHYYRDLLALTDKEPVWYDECGVPRWCKFKPGELNNLYADEVALVEIRCQNCGKTFFVGFSYSQMATLQNQFAKSILHYIKNKTLHYGDPPAHGCTGDTMNCEDIRVVEYWRQKNFRWHRYKSREIRLPDYYGIQEAK